MGQGESPSRPHESGEEDMNASDVELCVAHRFGIRRNVIVPNVSWGMNLHYEADVVVLRRSGFAIEIEIKVSASDIKADQRKRHTHNSNLFRELWFAVPEKLADHPDIPKRAGILVAKVSEEDSAPMRRYTTEATRGPTTNKNAKRWTDAQRMKLLSLSAMRIWNLKHRDNLRRHPKVITA